MQTLRGELPDPDGGRDLDELVGQLRLLKMWAGDPSYEVITRRIAADGAEARKSTVADCFRIGRRRLNAELVLAIVRALQDQPEYVERWQRALRVVAGESEASAHISVEAGLPEDLAGFTGRTAELATLQAELARTERPDGLGEAAHDQARYADAVSLFTEALAISSEVSSTAQQARAHVGLGHAFRALGDPDGRGESHRRRGAAIYVSLGMAPLPSPAER